MTRVLRCSAAALSLACYGYVPASLDEVAPGTPVRAVLSTEAQRALPESLGLRRRAVQGTLVDRNGDRLLLDVRSDEGQWRGTSRPLYQRVVVAPRDVLQVEVRRLQRGRTYGLLATLTAAATVVTLEAIRRGNPGTPGSSGGGPPE